MGGLTRTDERFWSSGILTGSQTAYPVGAVYIRFWSSGILTGSQTLELERQLEAAVLEQWHSDW